MPITKTTEKLPIYRYKFHITNIVLEMGNKQYQILDEMAISFAYIADYLNRNSPIMKLILQLEKELVLILYQNKQTAKISFEIYESEYDNENTKVNTKLWMRHTFNIIPVRDITHYTLSQNAEIIRASDPMSHPQGVELYLVDYDIIDYMKKKISINLKNISRPAILQSLFELRKIPPKTAIATPPENTDSIDNCMLSFATLKNNITDLNERYGIYTSAPLVFHDYINLYCLNRAEPNIVLNSANDFNDVVFLLINALNVESKVIGACTDISMRTHFINIQGAPEINDFNTNLPAVEFANVESVDANSGVVKSKSLNSTNATATYIYDQNPLSTQQAINEHILHDQTVSFEISDSPISVFKPYKTYSFITDSQYQDLDISGHKYRLNYIEFAMTKEGHQFESSMRVTLTRVSNTSNL